MKIEIPFLLPYKLPVGTGKKAISIFPGYAQFTISFDTYIKKITYPSTYEYLDIPEEENTIVYLEICPELKNKVTSDEDKTALIKESLDHGIQYVNAFIDAFRSINGLTYLRNIDFLDLPKHTIIKFNDELTLYTRIEELIPLVTDTEVTKEAFQSVMSCVATWNNYPEIGLVEQFYSQAESSLYKGDYTHSIIQLQTSFEIFIRTALKISTITKMEKRNKRRSEIDKKVKQLEGIKNFRNLFEKHLGSNLGTDLSFDKNPVINAWVKSLYAYRNSIVHAGNKNITRDQVTDAFSGYKKVKEYLNDLLNKNGYSTPSEGIDLTKFRTYQPLTEEMFNKLKGQGLLPADVEMKFV
ncbi:hypothetical protein [Bacillus cereus group sp. BfR-BA-01309]|uniref:hypothetical protein n=1 Tax=Bacillus cereus group sp. BfR-BA-01309 TaxID=2920286 RepID=UPI001F591FD1|nr:hypothetical protein [Bacillus cereus group sp. BfR-BA-01309]